MLSMSILSDKSIKEKIEKKEIIINPYNEVDVQPSSIDLHLSNDLKTINGESINILDDEPYNLQAGEFILGSTKEWIEIPDDIVATVEGRSSIGRLGITAHITAGYIDPGFKGNITLEIANISAKTFQLKNNMSLCQIVFHELTTKAQRPYGAKELNSKYQNSKGTIKSRLK